MYSLNKNLVEKCKDGMAICIIGAGISMNVKRKENGNSLFPSWKEFLESTQQMLREENKDDIAEDIENLMKVRSVKGIYYEVAKLAKDNLGQLWYHNLNKCFNPDFSVVDERSLAVPKKIWGIGHNVKITTNYDKVLRWTCPNRNDLVEWNIESKNGMADFQQGFYKDRPVVWHIHGNIDDASSLIITKDGYAELYDKGKSLIKNKYEAAQVILSNLSSSFSFVFIGYSMNDDALGVKIQDIHNIFGCNTGPHYILINRNELEVSRKWNQSLFEFIPYDNYEDDLPNILDELGNSDIEKKQSNTEKQVIKQITDIYRTERIDNDLCLETTIHRYSIRCVEKFKELMINKKNNYLEPFDYLEKIGYLRNGNLTRAGVLLFTDNPSITLPEIFPSIIVQCARYDGITRDAKRDIVKISQDIVSQVINARKYVELNVKKWKKPNSESMQSKAIYSFPMVCIREMIANAICHRDYNDTGRMVYVRLFDDRIEIANPGKWACTRIEDNIQFSIDMLKGEPNHKNIEISRAMSMIDIIEMEGSGIPVALEDCKENYSKKPMVIQKDGFVTVTVFPSYSMDKKEITKDKELGRYIGEYQRSELSGNRQQQIMDAYNLAEFHYNNSDYQKALEYIDIAKMKAQNDEYDFSLISILEFKIRMLQKNNVYKSI
jgi:predicted HTH transcriptional regulator